MREISLATALFFVVFSFGCGGEDSENGDLNLSNTTADSGSDAGESTDSGETSGDSGGVTTECTSDDTSRCPDLPNTTIQGCVVGECAYSCMEGFEDQNGDLSSADSDGCEASTGPSCRRTQLGESVSLQSEIHISQWGESGWLAAWLDSESRQIEIRLLDEQGQADGDVVVEEPNLLGRQTFDLLRPHGQPEVREFYVGSLTNSGETKLYRCSEEICDAIFTSDSLAGSANVIALEGFWQGDEQVPQFGFQTEEAVQVGAFLSGSFVVVHNATESRPNWFDLRPRALPDDPTNTTPTELIGSGDDNFTISQRLNSGDTITQPFDTCNVPTGPLGRVETVDMETSAFWLADTAADGDSSTISSIDCNRNQAIPQTERVIENLVDWDAEFEGNDTAFSLAYIDGTDVLLTTPETREPQLLAQGPIKRVAIATNSSEFGALLVEENGAIVLVTESLGFEGCR